MTTEINDKLASDIMLVLHGYGDTTYLDDIIFSSDLSGYSRHEIIKTISILNVMNIIIVNKEIKDNKLIIIFNG